MEEFELVGVPSGAMSLRCRHRKEIFHPGIGPTAEATQLHVNQQKLWERCRLGTRLVIWDVGLGAAANAITAINALSQAPGEVEIHSFDCTTAPLEFARDHAGSLEYPLPYLGEIKELLTTGRARPAPRIQWFLHGGDFRETVSRPELPAPHSIFYDPYSPGTNHEMWNLELFTRLRARLTEPCLWTNYTRSTAVRATLLLAGFYVGIGEGIHKKDETTVASNESHWISRPLGADWLRRVNVSRNGAPLRAERVGVEAISPADFERLKASPQFRVESAPERR